MKATCQDPAGTGTPGLNAFWNSLPRLERRKLLHVPRKTLFEAIRTRYCSRCFGLFSLRYDELRCSNAPTDQTENGCSSCAACPACQNFFLGLQADEKGITLDDRLFAGEPFAMFKQSKIRERERDIQFMTAGDVCGSGFNTKRSGKVCALHTTCVSPETLLAYWDQLPAEHRTALLTLPRHDFEAELESCCSLQLRICKDCRFSVVGQYKIALAAGRKTTAAAAAAAAKEAASCAGSPTACAKNVLVHDRCSENCCSHLDGALPLDALGGNVCDCCTTSCAAVEAMGRHLVSVCDGFWLSVTDTSVQLIGSDAVALLEEAEEIEDLKASETGDDDNAPVRHAETPELAREALVDAVILIFKAQIEVAFREQTAGHNALLLLVALAHELLEGRLVNAALDVRARAAEVELLELVEDEKRSAARPSRSQRRKAKHASMSAPIREPTSSVVSSPEDPLATPSEPLANVAAAAGAAANIAKEDSSTMEATCEDSQADPTASSDICSVAETNSCQALWDFGSGDDQAGGDSGEWEVKQRGRRPSGRRTSISTTAAKPQCPREPGMSHADGPPAFPKHVSQMPEAFKGQPIPKSRPDICAPSSSYWSPIADAIAAHPQSRPHQHHQQQQQSQKQQQLSASDSPLGEPPAQQHIRSWAQAALLKLPQPPTGSMRSRNTIACSSLTGRTSSTMLDCATPTLTDPSGDAMSASNRSSLEYNLWGGVKEDTAAVRSRSSFGGPTIPHCGSRDSIHAAHDAMLPTSSPSFGDFPAAVTIPPAFFYHAPATDTPDTAGSNVARTPLVHRQPDPHSAVEPYLPQDPRRSDVGFSLFSNFPVVGPQHSYTPGRDRSKSDMAAWGSFDPKGSPNLHHCLAENGDSIRAF